MLRITSYDGNSTAGKKLAKALGNIPMGTWADHRRNGDTVINWGRCNEIDDGIWLNKPSAVKICTDKFKTYDAFVRAGVPTPIITRSLQTARQWYEQGHGVYCRDTPHGMKGEGITFHQKGVNDIEPRETLYYTARFYTTREFRVYVVFGKGMVFEKKRRNGTNPDEYIRANDDWVYCLNNLAPYPDALVEVACRATKACGLDFGGVDCAIDAQGNVGVFEVNSAPYLDDRAAEWMANLIREKFDEQCEAQAAPEEEECDIVDRLFDRGDALSLRAARRIQALEARA